MSTHLRSSMAGLIYQVAAVLTGVLLTPIFLRQLGAEIYGIWALLNVVIAYASLSDIGITGGMVMFVGSSRNDEERSRLITTGTLANMLMALLVILLLLALKDTIIGSLFKVAGEQLRTTQQAYLLTLGTFLLMMVARSFSAVPDALQRVDLRLLIEAGTIAFSGILTWTVLQTGGGLLGVAIVTLLVGALRATVMGLAMKHVYPRLRFRLGLPKAQLARVFGYGLKGQPANIGATLSDPLLKSFVAAGSTTAHVGALQIGVSLASLPNSVVFSMIAGLFPAIAERHGAGDTAGIVKLAARYLLYVACFLFPISMFLIVAAPSVVTLWLGAANPVIATTIRISAFAFGFRALGLVPWCVAWGTEASQVPSLSTAIHIALLSAAGFALLATSRFTYAGILVAYLVSYAASAAFLFWRLRLHLPDFFAGANRWLLTALSRAAAISLVCGLLNIAVNRFLVADILRVAVGSAILLLAYLLILALAFPKIERQKALHLILQIVPVRFVWKHTP